MDASPLPGEPESKGAEDESCAPSPASGHPFVLFAELEQPSAKRNADAVTGRKTLMGSRIHARRSPLPRDGAHRANQQELCRDATIRRFQYPYAFGRFRRPRARPRCGPPRKVRTLPVRQGLVALESRDWLATRRFRADLLHAAHTQLAGSRIARAVGGSRDSREPSAGFRTRSVGSGAHPWIAGASGNGEPP